MFMCVWRSLFVVEGATLFSSETGGRRRIAKGDYVGIPGNLLDPGVL